MLGNIKFMHASQWFIDRQKVSPVIEYQNFPQDMYTIEVTEQTMEEYMTILKDILNRDDIELN